MPRRRPPSVAAAPPATPPLHRALYSATLLLIILLLPAVTHSFTLEMMGSRRGKGNLKKALDPSSMGDNGGAGAGAPNARSLNQGRGQEITGVTLPTEGKIKGWEFGSDKRMACANYDGTFYAVDGACPRCAFDLWKGTLITDEESFGPDVPRVACPTCATTYSLRTGSYGPPVKREGLAGWVGKLSKAATVDAASRDVTAYFISRDQDTGKVYCRER